MLGGGKKAQGHAHGVHRRVGHLDAHFDRRIDVRLTGQHFGMGQPANGDAAILTRFDEFLAISDLFIGYGDKKAVVEFK